MSSFLPNWRTPSFKDGYCTTQPFLVGFHAISRVPSPASPEAFGLRPELERWVLRLALRKAEQWPHKAPSDMKKPRVFDESLYDGYSWLFMVTNGYYLMVSNEWLLSGY